MQPYIFLIPEEKAIKEIYKIRKTILDRGLAEKDPRNTALPHITLVYFEENLTDSKIQKTLNQLKSLKFDTPIHLGIKDIVSWEEKVVAMLEISPLKTIKANLGELLRKTDIKFNKEYMKLYGDTIGDHMKLARQVSLNKQEQVKRMFREQLPDIMKFERVAFIDYGAEEKDILWQKQAGSE